MSESVIALMSGVEFRWALTNRIAGLRPVAERIAAENAAARKKACDVDLAAWEAYHQELAMVKAAAAAWDGLPWWKKRLSSRPRVWARALYSPWTPACRNCAKERLDELEGLLTVVDDDLTYRVPMNLFVPVWGEVKPKGDAHV